MVTIDNKRLVEEYWDAISGKAKPISVLERFIADPEFLSHVRAYEEAFPHYELIAEDYICENDRVAVRARVLGTHKGELMGIPPTGKRIDLPFTVIYRIMDERIEKGWLFVDRMELMNQLGISSMN